MRARLADVLVVLCHAHVDGARVHVGAARQEGGRASQAVLLHESQRLAEISSSNLHVESEHGARPRNYRAGKSRRPAKRCAAADRVHVRGVLSKEALCCRGLKEALTVAVALTRAALVHVFFFLSSSLILFCKI